MGILSGKEEYKSLASDMLFILKDAIEKYPSSFGRWATGLMNAVYGIHEIAHVGRGAMELARRVHAEFVPNKVLMASADANDDFPLLEGKIVEKDTHNICM